MITMLEDTMLSTARRTQSKMQSLQGVFDKKLTIMDEAQRLRRDEAIRRLGARIDDIVAGKGNGEEGDARDNNDRGACG